VGGRKRKKRGEREEKEEKEKREERGNIREDLSISSVRVARFTLSISKTSVLILHSL
jgi:hypothetical protein